MRIVFMGTPEFAVAILERIIKEDYDVAGVVTVPDKPAGRGLKIITSAIKQYAEKHSLPVLQPDKLKDPEFIQALQALHADLFVVVAFRMLPEVVWNMPRLGTFNLHASLLPQYRGAAPINWAIINGEKESGVTTFFLDKEIDTGAIIMQEKVAITDETTAGDLHDLLMEAGADLTIRTIQAIETGQCKKIYQDELIKDAGGIKHAPKIFREQCRIDWSREVHEVYNLIRGLSPYPAAYTELTGLSGNKMILKIYQAGYEVADHTLPVGHIKTDGKNWIKIACKGGFIVLKSLQLEGRKRMPVDEFLRGTKDFERCIVD